MSKPWSEPLNMLRTEIRSAGITNWRSLPNNITTCVDIAYSYVRANPEIEDTCKRARQRCTEFVSDIADRGISYSPEEPASKKARELALLALDELEELLQTARPSELATSLGLGW